VVIKTKRAYKHLSLEEREELYALWKYKEVSLRDIAKTLNRSHGTLSRELRRNVPKYWYSYTPAAAQKMVEKRRRIQRASARLKHPVISEYVRDKLKLKWSPETIAGRLSIDKPGYAIHFETIYRFIYRDSERGNYLWIYLTHARKRRMKRYGRCVVKRRGKIPDAVSIDLRPPEVAARRIIGHWETDNVIGRKTDAGALSTTVERLSRYTLLTKLKSKTAEEKCNALVWRLVYFPRILRKTLTTDNGFENTKHQAVTRALDTPMYFCHAFHSWEKGTVENTNGRIRRYIPKGKSIDLLTGEEIAAFEQQLNNTPRKCLGFRTPEEVMQSALEITGVTKLRALIKNYGAPAPG